MPTPRQWLGVLNAFILGATLVASPSVLAAGNQPNPSIFIRYQFDLADILALLKQAEGQPLDPASIPARWLDEMGWRNVVQEFSAKPFKLSTAFKSQLEAQDKFLKVSLSYQEGDAVWVPAEAGEQPYGYSSARVNPRAQIKRIITSGTETYFVVEVGIDNGNAGMRTITGTYYDGKQGPVLTYSEDFAMEKKTYVYSKAELDRFNSPYRSAVQDSAMETKVNYETDTVWLDKISKFKDAIIKEGIGVDFTKSPAEIYKSQRTLIKRIFKFFKMDRSNPRGTGTLGNLSNGGGECFTQACVLSNAVHAVGEPYGITSLNINGAQVNPAGGHGFTRITATGPEEIHVFDIVLDKNGAPMVSQNGKVIFKGLEIKSGKIHVISDPGWFDYGTTPDIFADMAVEQALNPHPVNANRALYDIVQGRSVEEIATKYGSKGSIITANSQYPSQFTGASSVEFLAPKGQIAEAAKLEKALGAEITALVDEAKNLKATIAGERTNTARVIKSRILTDIVEKKAGSIKVPGLTGDGLRVLLTEYLFRAVK